MKDCLTLEGAWNANLELRKDMNIMKTNVENVQNVCTKLLELTIDNKEKDETNSRRESEVIERLKEENIRKEQEYELKLKEEVRRKELEVEERLKDEVDRKEFEYNEKLKKMTSTEREKFLLKEKESEKILRWKDKSLEEQRDRYKEVMKKLKEKEMMKDLPIIVTSESESSEEDLELNSDGEFPDFTGMSKNDIETYAYRIAAKKAYAKGKNGRKVVLKKNKKATKDPHMKMLNEMNENLKGIMKNRLIEMKVSTATIVPLITNGGNYGVIIEGLLPKWKDFLNLWIQEKEISRKEKLQFREQLQTAIAAYSGIKIMGEKAASIAKAALTDVKDGELKTSAHSILKSVEDDYGSYNKRDFGGNGYKKNYNNANKEEGDAPPSNNYQGRNNWQGKNYNAAGTKD
eukprot:GHVR01129897.1.p1 GENE.GHVR01129897.1~~GHVR01129897.1.p1  ORF type:complete len:404 (+),score=67.56 GHVR01129897.1:51-1262(+)